MSDQPYNARRRQALGDPAYRERARDLQREFLALPPLDQLVRDIEALRGE